MGCGKPDTASLSLLRFLASMIVVLFHCRTRSDFLSSAPRIFSAGPQMVTFFFVLSGFSLMLGYYGKTEFAHKEYWTKRASRIVPIYLIAIFLALLVNSFQNKAFDPIALVLHLTFTHALVPSYPLSINGPAWFMSVLAVFYALFPMILAYIKTHAPRPGRLFMGVLALWLITQACLSGLLNSGYYQGFPSLSHDVIYYFPLSHLSSFLLGVAAAYGLIRAGWFRMSGIKALVLFVLSIAVLVLVIEHQVFLMKAFHLRVPFGASFYAPLFLIIIVSGSMIDGRLKQCLSSRFCVALGDISFAVYMIQIPVRSITSYGLDRFPLSYDMRLLVYMFVVTALGFSFFYGVERPIKDYVRKNPRDNGRGA